MNRNLEIAHAFISAMAAGAADIVVSYLDEDVAWHLPSSLADYGLATDTTGKATVAQMASGFAAFFKETRAEVEIATSSSDAVALLVRIRGVTHDDRPYDNRYSFWLRFRDGLIVDGREVTDTALAVEFFRMQKPALTD